MAVGKCGVCGASVKINKNGELRSHKWQVGDEKSRCPGSNGDPVPTFIVTPDPHEFDPDA